MRLFFILLGILIVQTAYALPLDAPPSAGSPYVRSLLRAVQQGTEQMISSGPSTNTQFSGVQKRLEAAQDLQNLFGDAEAIRLSRQDIVRSPCWAADIQAIETVLADLIVLMMDSAGRLDFDARSGYFHQIQYLWEKLQIIRQYGLDPSVQRPVYSQDFADAPPLFRGGDADDALCPYDSDYAMSEVGDAGCNALRLPSDVLPFLNDEAGIFHLFLSMITGTSKGIPAVFILARSDVDSLRTFSDTFVRGLQTALAPMPFRPLLTSFFPAHVSNNGESGCLGWPSDVQADGAVSGENITRIQGFPDVSTPALARAFALLQSAAREQGDGTGSTLFKTAYLQSLAPSERAFAERHVQQLLLQKVPQSSSEALANRLHEATRSLTRHVVSLRSETEEMPPLRDFVARFSQFLLGMCSNRGCDTPILRAFEMVWRDECFLSFQSALYFLEHPDTTTLPTCSAKYTNP